MDLVYGFDVCWYSYDCPLIARKDMLIFSVMKRVVCFVVVCYCCFGFPNLSLYLWNYPFSIDVICLPNYDFFSLEEYEIVCNIYVLVQSTIVLIWFPLFGKVDAYTNKSITILLYEESKWILSLCWSRAADWSSFQVCFVCSIFSLWIILLGQFFSN